MKIILDCRLTLPAIEMAFAEAGRDF